MTVTNGDNLLYGSAGRQGPRQLRDFPPVSRRDCKEEPEWRPANPDTLSNMKLRHTVTATYSNVRALN
jgi:hypothetical protein